MGSTLVTLGHIFRLIEGFFGQMSIIKRISHVLESILDGFLTVLELTVFLIPKGPSQRIVRALIVPHSLIF